jgi:hypothetical protein
MLLAAVLTCTVASICEATYITSCSVSCQKNEYKTGCYGTSASGKLVCDTIMKLYQRKNFKSPRTFFTGYCSACGFLCPPGQFASGCGGTDPGACLNCTSCNTGHYAAGCGGVQPGVCTECTKCQGGKYAVGCAGGSPGACQNASSASESKSPEYPLPAIIATAIGLPFMAFVLIRSQRGQQRWAKAVALREEKLHAQGLACVRLVNRTSQVVQVRPSPATRCAAPRRSEFFSSPLAR